MSTERLFSADIEQIASKDCKEMVAEFEKKNISYIHRLLLSMIATLNLPFRLTFLLGVHELRVGVSLNHM